MAETTERYVGKPVQRLHGSPHPTHAEGLADQEAVLRAAGFDVASYDFETPHTWTRWRRCSGNLRSTSFASRAGRLGEGAMPPSKPTSPPVLRGYDPAERYGRGRPRQTATPWPASRDVALLSPFGGSVSARAPRRGEPSAGNLAVVDAATGPEG